MIKISNFQVAHSIIYAIIHEGLELDDKNNRLLHHAALSSTDNGP